MKKIMKKVQSIIMVLTLALTFLFAGKVTAVHGTAAANGFYVSGTTLYDANGKPFVMRGINMAHNWYKGNTAESIRGIAATGANTVRVVLSNGAVWSRDSENDVKNIIQQCKDNKLIAVLEVHDTTGKDDRDSLDRAIDYWINIKGALIGNEKYVILNIANEWYGTWNSSGWRDGYLSAIPRIRNAGIKNTLMVDCAGWGQYPKSIMDSGAEVFNADPQRNTMFSIHMYEYAGGNASTVESNINGVLNKNLPLVIGEFGGYHTGGDVDEYAIMRYCQQRGVGYLGWSWKGNNADMNYLDISNTFSGGSYTPWGNTLINDANGIRATSKICSVYTGSSGEGSYIQYFYGSKYAGPWTQAVSILTNRAGGPINISDIRQNGYFYVEYTGAYGAVELCLQSWSGGPGWVKVNPSESGTSGGIHYAKFNYNDLVGAYGNLSLLDQAHVGATHSGITVIKLQYAMLP